MTRLRWLLAALLAAIAACFADPMPTPATGENDDITAKAADGGAGTTAVIDAGAATDAGTPVDGGAAPDAGEPEPLDGGEPG